MSAIITRREFLKASVVALPTVAAMQQGPASDDAAVIARGSFVGAYFGTIDFPRYTMIYIRELNVDMTSGSDPRVPACLAREAVEAIGTDYGPLVPRNSRLARMLIDTAAISLTAWTLGSAIVHMKWSIQVKRNILFYVFDNIEKERTRSDGLFVNP